MKKTAIIFLSLLLFAVLPLHASASVATTVPQESTAAETAEGREQGLFYEADISAPITGCIIAVSAFIVYGIVKLKKAGNETDKSDK